MGRRFWEKPKLPIGVDFGTMGIKAIQLQPIDDGFEVIAAAQLRYPKPLPDDPAARTKMIQQTLSGVLDLAPFDSKDVVLSPVLSDLNIRAVRLPKLDDSELTKAARWEASERFARPVEELQVDWIRAGEVGSTGDVREEIILLAIERTRLNCYLDAALECKLAPDAVDVPFAASARLATHKLRREGDHSIVQMTINVGHGGTTVTITRGRDLAFVKYLDTGGRSLTQAVANHLDLDEDAAQQLREERKLAALLDLKEMDSDDRVARATLDATRPLLHEIGQEAALCLRYYSVTFRGARPQRVQIVGGEAGEPQLAQIVSDELKVQATVENPLEGMEFAPEAARFDRRKTVFTQWAVAAGLSLRPTVMDHAASKPSKRKAQKHAARRAA